MTTMTMTTTTDSLIVAKSIPSYNFRSSAKRFVSIFAK